MGHIDVAGVGFHLPDGRVLLDEVSFRVGEGMKAVLVGANGSGKTTLLRIVAGDLQPSAGSLSRSGGLGVMRQFIGSQAGADGDADGVSAPLGSTATVRDLLVSVSPPTLRRVARELREAEAEVAARADEDVQMRYAQALADWADVGGYDAEVLWDVCTVAALGVPFDRAGHRELATLSGGEQKRLVLEALLRGPDEVLLLDEPDNYLDVPGKRWLEERLRTTPKTVLFVSHDRELLARTATHIITLEGGMGVGNSTWVHGGGYEGYHQARADRHARFAEQRRRWDERHARLKELVRELWQKAAVNDGMASRYQAAMTRLRRFEEAGPPPEPPRERSIRMRLRGGRTGVRALTCVDLELTGLMRPFSTEVFYGERVAVLGSNGSGKSHFLRLLAGDGRVAHTGEARLGARVNPGHFAQTHHHPEWVGRTPAAILAADHALPLEEAAPLLQRYELVHQRDQRFETLSGGQQARFQILLLEVSGATMLLLDEPTDNLDVESAEALEAALEEYEGTVLAVTHDRWFARSFDRFLVFGADGTVYEAPEPVWDEARVRRARP
ncbi:ATP-binding cassette domain-containing protein [Marinactinospora thermotolerans]|uniref:ATPase components of ABC transporters with duplicated ATPase domains n=1 Tax=Marinactinospora thermotolerans DSM 45154 TaxID=1122192 RepID=A0A1T4R1S6_9ACTN|nr:ATP-binding cassette domain-containing protein [Marinactinospora thermotolerans]SKA09817.1 ATPase components of ABC transporters with duplicated ATPase domains [Marinactinospora thermotolerans DSM 45154]